jgi:YHS domain-containing protein
VLRRLFCLGALAVPLGACAIVRPPRAPIPLISTTDVHTADSVEAAGERAVLGKIDFAHRDSEVVRYFASAKNQALYTDSPRTYPTREAGVKLAQMGSDPVLRLPNGVRDQVLGPLLQGDPANWELDHKGTTFAFNDKKTLNAFRKNPERYIPAVGGYCLGAMSRGDVVPGDPRNHFFVPEAEDSGIWAYYGSPKGPEAWKAMTPDERRKAIAAAVANYAQYTAITRS